MKRHEFPNSRSTARNGVESTSFLGQKDPRALTTPLKRDPGGPKAKALVENVIAALEQCFDGAAHLEALKPQLEVLIKMSEDMAEAMKSQKDVCVQARTQALLKIGDCNDKKQALEEVLVKIEAQISKDRIIAAEDKKKQQDICDNLKQIRKEIFENYEVIGISVPIYGQLLQFHKIWELHDLQSRLDKANAELRLTDERLSFMDAHIRNLVSEKDGMERELHHLNEINYLLDRKSKAYARREVDFHEAKMYYLLLRNEIENLQGSLDLPKIVKQLLQNKELVHITGDQTGQQEQSTLKELLIHLGGEYDHYLENGLPEINDGVAGAGSSFQYKIAPLQVGPLFGNVSTYPTWPTSKL